MTRFGVAIAVPDPFGALLREKRAYYGDPQAAVVPTHVTLTPPVDADCPVIDALRERLADVAASTAPFAMELKGTDSFRPVSPVVFVTVTDGVEATDRLAEQVRALVPGPPPQFPFHAHVTVAQHLIDGVLDEAAQDLADFSCRFEVEEFALYLHDDATGWTPFVSFALTGPRS